jgi:hypothetical protein
MVIACLALLKVNVVLDPVLVQGPAGVAADAETQNGCFRPPQWFKDGMEKSLVSQVRQ